MNITRAHQSHLIIIPTTQFDEDTCLADSKPATSKYEKKSHYSQPLNNRASDGSDRSIFRVDPRAFFTIVKILMSTKKKLAVMDLKKTYIEKISNA